MYKHLFCPVKFWWIFCNCVVVEISKQRKSNHDSKVAILLNTSDLDSCSICAKSKTSKENHQISNSDIESKIEWMPKRIQIIESKYDKLIVKCSKTMVFKYQWIRFMFLN